MLRSTLQQTHDAYDADTWGDYDALYAGGKKFFARAKRFLHQNPTEPPGVYLSRLREAHYRCYLGGIVDYFAASLLISPLVVRAKNGGKAVDPNPFYGEFKEDCDGQDNDIHVFVRGRVTEALIKRCSWWLVQMPEQPQGATAESLAEWREMGLDRAKVKALDAEQVLDWEVDDDGQMVWAIVFSVKICRPSPTDKRTQVIERYDVYDRDNVERFELTYDKSKKPARDVDIPSKGVRPHGFSRVPLVNIDVTEALWLANRVASPQLEHFRLSNAQTWGIRRTCYAMPVFKLEDREKPPTMGAGYYIMIGKEEGMEWGAPPSAPFAVIREEVKDQKDEIFRIVQMMAMGVDNNAAAVGRSAKSKEVDAAAVRVILGALGEMVRESVERTYALLSEGRGEEYDWAIEGMDDFTEVDLTELVTAAQGLQLLNIPSPTLHRSLYKRIAMAAVPDESQDTKDDIAAEIEKNVTDESVLAPPVIPAEEPDGDEPTEPEGDEPAAAKPAPKAKPGAKPTPRAA